MGKGQAQEKFGGEFGTKRDVLDVRLCIGMASAVMCGFIYDTKSIMFDQHLVLSALSNVGIFISICGQLKKVTNKR